MGEAFPQPDNVQRSRLSPPRHQLIDLGTLTPGLRDPSTAEAGSLPVVARQMLLQVSGGDIGQVTDL
jgi:hypothetical protein